MVEDKLLKSPVEFREWFRVLVRHWAGYFTPAENMVLLFIFDRTFGWGKEWEIISSRQMEEGIYYVKPDGAIKEIAGGIGVSAKNARRLIPRLVAIGVLRQKALPGKRRMLSINYEWNPDMLKLPKNFQAAPALKLPQKTAVACPKLGQGHAPNWGKGMPQIGALYKERTNKRTKKEDNPTRQGGAEEEESKKETLGQKINRVQQKAAAQREKKKARAEKTGKASLPMLQALWEKACQKAFPSHPLVTHPKKDWIILQAESRRFSAAQREVSFVEFLEWSLEHWQAVMAGHFQWVKQDRPEYPSIRFLVRFSSKFQAAYGQRASIARKAGLTPKEQEIARLVEGGRHTPEAAERAVEERHGLARQRQLLEADTKKLKRLQQMNADRALAEDRQDLAKVRPPVARKRPPVTAGTFGVWDGH